MKINSLTTPSVKDGFLSKTFACDENRPLGTEDFNQAKKIIAIERFSKTVAASKKDIFKIEKRPSGSSFFNFNTPAFFYYIKPYLSIDLTSVDDGSIKSFFAEEIHRCFAVHRLNPYADLYLKIINEELVGKIDPDCNRSKHSDDELVTFVETLNGFISRLRSELNSPQFKTSLKNFERSIRKNDTTLNDFINAQFIQNSNLLVLRLSLSYKGGTPSCKINEITEQYALAKKDRDKLLRDMPSNNLFEGMLGCAWMSQYAGNAGFSFQLLLIFNRSEQEEMNLPKLIGEHWVINITEGRGQYFSFKTTDSNCKSLGTGIINRDDPQPRAALKELASSLIKSDYFSKFAPLEANGKAFGIVKRAKAKSIA